MYVAKRTTTGKTHSAIPNQDSLLIEIRKVRTNALTNLRLRNPLAVGMAKAGKGQHQGDEDDLGCHACVLTVIV
jgi:hypothetical protein